MSRRLASLIPALLLAAAALVAGGAHAQSQPAAAPPADAAPAQSQPPGAPLFPTAAEQAERQKTQPGNNAPVWREARSGGQNYASIPGREASVLIQSGGQTWRERRNNQLIPLGGWIFAGVFVLCALFYLWRGTIKLKHPETGRKLLRFTGFERMVHWTVATTFSILAISGLTMAFGKMLLLPLIGHTLFGWLALVLKNLHNFVGPLFVLGVVVMFVTFIKDNWPKGYDLTWLRKGGGLASGVHAPAGKYNAGEKLWFWGGLLLLGVTASLSGLVLDFPNFDQLRSTMQLANVVHLSATMLMMAAALGHIYMGTIGQAGAYQAMKTGYVDEEWAKEHHDIWYEEVKHEAGKGPAPSPAGGGPVPAAAPQSAKHRKEQP